MKCDLPDTEFEFSPEIHAMMGVHALFWKIEEQVEQINLTPPLSKQERQLLICLGKAKRMGVLAREMASLPSTVTAIADSLEGKGFVLRTRDPDDRRAYQLDLTSEGILARDALVKKAGELFRQISGLSSTEIETFARLAAKARETALEAGIPEGMKK